MRRVRAGGQVFRRSSVPVRVPRVGTNARRACLRAGSSRLRHSPRLRRGVAVVGAVTELLHQPGRRVAQVLRHAAALVLGDESAGGIIGDVGGVRFGRHGHVEHGIGQRQLAFRAAQALVGGTGVAAASRRTART